MLYYISSVRIAEFEVDPAQSFGMPAGPRDQPTFSSTAFRLSAVFSSHQEHPGYHVDELGTATFVYDSYNTRGTVCRINDDVYHVLHLLHLC